MDPPAHFITSLILSFLLYPYFGNFSILVFIGGFLIDIDHYIIYIMEKRGFGPISCYRYMKENLLKYKSHFFIFHNIELIALIAAGSFFYHALIPIAAGLAVHYSLDLIKERIIMGEKLKVWSFFLYLLKK